MLFNSYSLFTPCSFDHDNKNKHGYFGGKDYMKKFCEDLSSQQK